MTTGMRVAVAAVCVLILAACASTARFYNVDTGEVLNAVYENYGTGRGKITATTSSGKTLVGEYTTISGMAFSTSVGTATAVGARGYAWATAQGFSFSQPGQQYGAATLVGDGMILDIVYVVDPWSGNGHGVGRDNKGGKFRVHF